MASIRTAGLTKDFGDLRAVNQIDLDLPEGGLAGFVGPNGASKSTTIRMLLGLITPTGGGGGVLGHPIGRPDAYLHRVGALIEAPAFYPTLTGEANLQVTTAAGSPSCWTSSVCAGWRRPVQELLASVVVINGRAVLLGWGMPSSKLSPLVLSAEEVTTLEQWARRPKTAQALALRSRIV